MNAAKGGDRALSNSIEFGIVTPTFSRPKCLNEAIESVVAQTYPNWRLVIIDDSGDGSATRDVKTGDPRIAILMNDHNEGVNRSRNVGLERLIGFTDYITFLDDDDRFTPDTLSRAQAFLSRSGAQWGVSRRVSAASGKSFTKAADGVTRFDYIFDSMVGDGFSGDATHFVSSNLIRRAEARFPDEREYLAEWRFYASLAEHSALDFFEGAVTLGAEYQETNLSRESSVDIEYRVRELRDLCLFFEGLDLPPERSSRVRAEIRSHIALILPRALAHRRVDLAMGILRSAHPSDVVLNSQLHRRLTRMLAVGGIRRVVQS